MGGLFINCNHNCRLKEESKSNNTPMLIIDFNTGMIVKVNTASCDYYKYTKDELLKMNISDINVYTKEEVLNEMHKGKLEDKGLYRVNHLLSNGEVRVVDISSEEMIIGNDKLIIYMIYDIVDREKIEKKFKIDKTLFENLFNHCGEAIAIIDRENRVIDINTSFENVFQYELSEVKGKELAKLIVDEKYYENTKILFSKTSDDGFIKEEAKRKRKDGTIVDVLLLEFPLIIGGQLIGTYCMYTDISEFKEKELQIKKLTSRDTVTGLYNESYFFEILNKEIMKYGNNKDKDDNFLVVSLSINEYNEIFDALGPQIAAGILRKFSSKMRSMAEDQTVFARYNEGSFLILIPNVKDVKNVLQVINEHLNGLNTQISIDNYDLNITTNAGITIYPQNGQDCASLVRKANLALHESRKIGTDRAFLFDESLDNQVQECFWLKNDLFKDMDFDEFYLKYQPIYDVNINQLVGTEVLVRWNHKKRGDIPPLRFIPISEKTGMIYPIGEWVLYNACKQNKQWQDLGFKPIYISVNVSVLQLEQPDFYEKVKSILDETNMDPKCLQLEITETYFTKKYNKIVNIIKKLNNLGIRFAIDDFGTGYSSLAQLSELNINTLKIDRIFIDRVDSNVNKGKIVKTVISLARSMNIGLIAEGVEREEELNFLKENKCNIIQGYLFSKPVEAKFFIQYLSK